MAMDDKQKKILMIGGAAVVVIFILSKLLKGSDDESGATATPPIQNIGPSGQDVNERYALQATSQLAMQQERRAGLETILAYGLNTKAADYAYGLGLVTETNSTAIKNKELDVAVTLNSQNVESANLMARLANEAALGVASMQLQAEMAAIGGQVSIAGIMAGVESERTKADLQLGMRGYDSADYATGSNERIALADIDLQRFGITEGVGLQKYLADYDFILGKKQLKTERRISEDTNRTTIELGRQQTDAQTRMAEINRSRWWEGLFGALGNIIPAFA